jgi:hypothetical protein
MQNMKIQSAALPHIRYLIYKTIGIEPWVAYPWLFIITDL